MPDRVPTKLKMAELMEYALNTHVPEVFVERMLSNRFSWDHEFTRWLDELAYEFRPDLAVWYVTADTEGRLTQLRLAPTVTDLH